MMPWQPMQVAFFFWPAAASPVKPSAWADAEIKIKDDRKAKSFRDIWFMR
jgi:hypothetical protein